jgi:hypothetical protein
LDSLPNIKSFDCGNEPLGDLKSSASKLVSLSVTCGKSKEVTALCKACNRWLPSLKRLHVNLKELGHSGIRQVAGVGNLGAVSAFQAGNNFPIAVFRLDFVEIVIPQYVSHRSAPTPRFSAENPES